MNVGCHSSSVLKFVGLTGSDRDSQFPRSMPGVGPSVVSKHHRLSSRLCACIQCVREGRENDCAKLTLRARPPYCIWRTQLTHQHSMFSSGESPNLYIVTLLVSCTSKADDSNGSLAFTSKPKTQWHSHCPALGRCFSTATNVKPEWPREGIKGDV